MFFVVYKDVPEVSGSGLGPFLTNSGSFPTHFDRKSSKNNNYYENTYKNPSLLSPPGGALYKNPDENPYRKSLMGGLMYSRWCICVMEVLWYSSYILSLLSPCY